MLKTYLISALRRLLNDKTNAAITILGLAIGLACVMMIAAWSVDELSFDRFHAKHERIHRLVGRVATDSETFAQAVTSPPMAKALQRDYPAVENTVRLDMNDCVVRCGDKQFEEDGVLFTDQSFFEIFDYGLTGGDITTALEKPYSIVLSESIARKYFGDENPVGKSMTLYLYDPEGNGASYTVTGVTPDPPPNAHFSFTILGSFTTLDSVFPDAAVTWWFENSFYTYLLLQEGADAGELERELPEFAERYMGDKMREYKMFYTFSLQRLTDIYLHSDLRYEIGATGSLNTVFVLATIGLVILLLACINYVNLATARSLGRAREVGVKKVLGAGKSHLIRQVLVESIISAVIALLLALIIVELLQPIFFNLTAKQFDRIFSGRLLLFVCGIGVFAGLLSGLYPAFMISRFEAIRVLKGGFKASPGGILLRKGLVVLQFSIAIALIAGIAVVNSQMQFIQNKDLGFDRDALLVLDVNGFAEVQNEFAPFKNDLLSNPLISGVAVSRGTIVGGLGNSLIETVDGNGRPVSSSIYRQAIDPDYPDVYRISLIAGRSFTAGDTSGQYIVNEAAVRAFGWKDARDAVDKPFIHGGNRGRVIGVVKNFHFAGLQHAIAPMEFHLTRPGRFSQITLRMSTAELAASIDFVRRTWHSHFPNALLEYAFLDERLARQYQHERLVGDIFTVFVFLAIAIACLGLLGLTAIATEQRTREIGIRKVLGASAAQVVILLSTDLIRLVLIANIIAWPVAWLAMDRWLQNFAYRIEIDWWMFVLAGGTALLIALLTVSSRAIRAALANPVESLRYE